MTRTSNLHEAPVIAHGEVVFKLIMLERTD